MSSYKKIRILSVGQDQPSLLPILEQLRAKGLRIPDNGGEPQKTDVVLAALSEHFYADSEKVEKLLSLIGAGAENVLPLQLDDTPIPDAIKNALYARNIIPAAERDAAHTAERILSALPQKKNRLPLILSVAGIVLLVVAGLLIWRAVQQSKADAVPVMAEEPIVIPPSLGLTQEDLEQVCAVVIVGEDFRWYTREEMNESSEENFSYQYIGEDDRSHWISKEDGHEYSQAAYDLSFLTLMPNLESLRMQLVDADVPDLSGLVHLNDFCLQDSTAEDISFLAGSPVRNVFITRSPIADYSPLNSCGNLEEIHIEQWTDADFSTLSPAGLHGLAIYGYNGRREVDLSGLSDIKVREIDLRDVSLRDLSFLSGNDTATQLLLADIETLNSLDGIEGLPIRELQVNNCDELRDISAVGTLKALEDLYIEYCEALTDYTPISGCRALRMLMVHCDDDPTALRDASFLRDLPNLTEIHLYSCELRDMNFLEGIADNAGAISLHFAGQIEDYSGLAFIKKYAFLHLNPRRIEGSRFGDLSAVLPYLEGATVETLQVYECGGIDLSLLPEVTRTLEILGGDLRDLSTMPAMPICELRLEGCQYLSSLNGLETLPAFAQAGELCVKILDCPRLTDWSAMENAKLSGLELMGLYTLPVFDDLDFGSLHLESIDGLSDLHILDKLTDGHSFHDIELVGLEELQDISSLRRLRIEHLAVPPQVADQAQELVDEGVADEYFVAYPMDRGWQPFEGEVELLSLDELETLPKALLRRVERLSIAGDAIMDKSRYDFWEDWEHRDVNGNPTLLLHDRETDEYTPLSGGFTDLSAFSELTGLKELDLIGQPLETLDGIQTLSSLEFFDARGCAALHDASALFALPELKEVKLESTAVDSIQGIQNLTQLRELRISRTQVSDLTPLRDCDLSAAYAEGGLALWLDELELSEEDLAVLGTVKHFRELSFWYADPAVWMPALKNCEIDSLILTNALYTNEELAALVADHPEIRELNIDRQEGITDLSCLLALENLERLSLPRDMETVTASLAGNDCRFELDLY